MKSIEAERSNDILKITDNIAGAYRKLLIRRII
jgi:hypothetical protein